jgi:class 3 adenylate cyclase
MALARTLGIILGASEFPRAGLSGGSSFCNSANDFRAYLLDPTGLNLDKRDILDLFDDTGEPTDLLAQITDFLERSRNATEGNPTETLLLYYVGHGGFTPNGSEYFLAVRSTRKEFPWASGIRMDDLGRVIRDFARFQRRYFILDSCFSGQAYRLLQSTPVELAAIKTQASLPTKGTSVLCSSGPKQPSLAPDNLRHTMFSDALLQVLKTGAPHMGRSLTLREVRNMVELELRRRWDNELVRPEVHSPDQSEGDISDLPLFPNLGRRPGAEQKELTVMFTDIRSSTKMVETLSVEEFGETLNEYLNAMTEILFRNRGTLDKYIGDAIMAFWGAPEPRNDHAYRACCCALEMLVRQQQLNRKWEAEDRIALVTGIGLNTGPMMVGNIGSANHLTLTVMGDNVSIASRLEGINKEYGTLLIVSEATYQAVRDSDLVFRALDLIRVKGRLEPMPIYELLCRREEVTPELQNSLAHFARGRSYYHRRKWTEAEGEFLSILDKKPNDGPSRVFWKRCRSYSLEEPPSNWDGVFINRY